MVQGDWRTYAGAWELAPTKQGTMVRLRAELELPHVLDALVTADEAAWELGRDLDLALLNLKEQLEE
jgi:hypothetical protein